MEQRVPKIGDKVTILPGAVGLASEHIGETVTLTEVSPSFDLVSFDAGRGYLAPLERHEWAFAEARAVPAAPLFTVTCYSEYGSGSIAWSDEPANRRYHINFSERGGIEEVIHSNWINDQGKTHFQTHRELDITAAKWAPIYAHIKAVVAADDLIAKARAAYKAKMEAERAAERTKRAESIRAALLAVDEDDERAVTHRRRVVLSLAELSDEGLLYIARAIAAA